MSESHFSPATLFVGRETFLRALQEHLDLPRNENGAAIPSLLWLHGAAGFGKTALCRQWVSELKRHIVPHAMVDVRSAPSGNHLLLEIRLKMAESSRLKFDRFDRAYGRFHHLTTGLSWESNTPSSLHNTVVEATKLALPMVPIDLLITAHPFVKQGIERVLSKNEVEHKFKRDCRSEDPLPIQDWLPWALAQDLEDASSKMKTARPVLIFDSFEQCTPETRALLEQLCAGCPSVLKLFSGQNPPDEAWQGHNEMKLLDELKGLERDESREYLARRGIEDEVLQRHLSEISDGYPLRLQLCADACDLILLREDRQALASDFEGVSTRQDDMDAALREFLCRDLSGEIQDALRLAAIAPWFDRDLLGALVPLHSLWRIYPQLERLSGLCTSAPNPSGALMVRHATRQAFRPNARVDSSWDDWISALLARCLLLSQKAMRENQTEQALNYVIVGLQVGQDDESDSHSRQEARTLMAIMGLHQQAAGLLNGLQQFDAAVAHARNVCALAEACGDEAQWAKGVLMRVCTESLLNDEFGDFALLDRAIAVRRDAASGSSDQETHLALVEAELSKAGVAFRRERWDVARQALEQAKEHLAALPPKRLGPASRRRLGALITHAQMQGELEAHQGRWGEAEEHLRRAQTLCEELPSERSRASRECAAKGWLGIVGLHLQRADALTNVEAALRDERDVLHSTEGIAKWLHLLGESYADSQFAGRDLGAALHALWLSAEMREGLQHVESDKTKRLLSQIEDRTDPQDWQTMRREYDEDGIWEEWRHERV